LKKRTYTPRLIAWEVTRRCSLHCRHCRASAQNIPYEDELTFKECQQFLDGMRQFTPSPIMIVTGGDPMMRDDIYDIIHYGVSIGLRMVIALCGQFLSAEIINRLKKSGILKISFSLDGSNAASHDNFRRVEGSFDAVLRGMEYARQAGIPFQVNSTISRYNIHELPEILALTIQSGADSFHPFLLVPTGNAKELLDLELSPEEYENTLSWIYEQSTSQNILVKPTCAPHYARIVRQKEMTGSQSMGEKPPNHRQKDQHGFSTLTKGCLGGQEFAFVSHTGKVQICGFLDVECGDIRDTNFALKPIWENSRVFREIRDIDNYHGKCGICEYRHVCGGCRARAYNVTGDYLGSEPFCSYEPVSPQRD